jgi:hypothetical protein
MARNGLKYRRIDPVLRAESREAWNRPVLWPIAAVLVALVVLTIPAVRGYRRRERMAGRAAAT